VVYGAALEKREWLCHPVSLGAKQFVGKMSAKQRPSKAALKVKRGDF